MASKHSRAQYKPKTKGTKSRRKARRGGAYLDSSGAGTYSYGTSQKQMAELNMGARNLSVRAVPCVTGGKKDKKRATKRNRKSRRH